MIGKLPTTLTVGGQEWEIRTDYRDILLIFEALNDVDLLENEKVYIMLDALYKDFEHMPDELKQEACLQASIFIDGGTTGDKQNANVKNVKTLDWEQDEQLIFSAINNVAGKEIRLEPYLHWWTFLGYFMAMGECLLTSIMALREKKAKGKKLDKGEQAYYKANKSLIDFKKKYSNEQLEEMERLKKLLE